MKLKTIKIQNFKSVEEIEFDIKKYGSSYTTMFLGVNESGKSNILEAMSFLDAPEGEFNYEDYHNQKDENQQPVDLWFSLDFDYKSTYLNPTKAKFENGRDLLDFDISDIVKNVYLNPEDTEFEESYSFAVNNLVKGLYIKTNSKSINVNGRVTNVETYSLAKTAIDDEYQVLDEKLFKTLFDQHIKALIKKHEPSVTFWKPSDKYLISTEDLKSFAEAPHAKPALKNIFLLAGYDSKENIVDVVNKISNGQQRSRLQSKIQDSLDSYIKNVWSHNIDVVIDITETGQFTLSIRDSGEKNKHDRLPINGRSEGARHFLSLILSLSIESKHDKLTNQLILIDEPEVHLHPSGIRDLREELLKIGEKNFLFVSTHSPFLVDKTNKERNVIIKKNGNAKTEKKLIDNFSDTLDDEVLYEAFGLDVYKDLLNPHSILVEGTSDKVLILKALSLKSKHSFGITNGHGSNILTLASKLNGTVKSILVVLDDDRDGKAYKSKIIKLSGSYSTENVLTIKDLVDSLVDSLVDESTIEDLLGKNYVQSTFIKLYKSVYTEAECDIELQENQPFVKQLKAYLQQKEKKDSEIFIESLKSELANNFKVSKAKLEESFPLLDELTSKLINKLS